MDELPAIGNFNDLVQWAASFPDQKMADGPFVPPYAFEGVPYEDMPEYAAMCVSADTPDDRRRAEQKAAEAMARQLHADFSGASGTIYWRHELEISAGGHMLSKERANEMLQWAHPRCSVYVFEYDPEPDSYIRTSIFCRVLRTEKKQAA